MNEDTPVLSVVIASVNGFPMIEECLASLGAQNGQTSVEAIVVDATGEPTARLIRQRFPWVKLIAVPERLTIPQLRTVGLRHAKGEIVAIIEDHCIADRHWCEALVKAHRDHPECVAVGGAVENGSCTRLVDWAVFFCEYSTYMLPVPWGTVEDIPGNNASYKRRAFERIANLEDLLSRGFWESTLHQELRARGDRFLSDPSVVVYHRKRFGFRYFLSQRYHYSRSYAGRLALDASWPRRVLRSAAAAALLPPLLLGRIGGRVLRKRRHLRELVFAAPLLVIFTAAWAVGEAVGSVLGPGQSLREVE